MIDILTVVVPHVLMAIAVWRLLGNDELDSDPILPSSKITLVRRKARSPMPRQETPGA